MAFIHTLDTPAPLRFRGRTANRAMQFPVPPDTLQVSYGLLQIEEIERFRYSIYVAEQDKPLPAADHLAKRLPDVDDATALHFCVRNGARNLVGYARMHYADGLPAVTVARLGLGDLLNRCPKSLGFISKLMVDKSLRGRANAVRLIMTMIQYGCDRFKEAEGAFFHCSDELVPLYTRMGFRPFGSPYMDPHVGQQTPMVAIFRDLGHFQQCGSPIADVVESLPPGDLDSETFREYFLVKRAFHDKVAAHVSAQFDFRHARLMPTAPRAQLKSGLKLA